VLPPSSHPSTPGGAGQCGQLGLKSEGYALAEAMGGSSLYIWALGLLAAGQASTMVCTYAGQIIMGGCLQIKLKPWQQVAFTRLFALGPALLVAVTTGSDTSLFNNINEYLNILQSVQLPFAMLPVLHFAASRAQMGRFASGPALLVVAIGLALLVMSVNVLLIVQFIQVPPSGGEVPHWGIGIIGLVGAAYFALCARLVGSEIAGVWRALCRCLGCSTAAADGASGSHRSSALAGADDGVMATRTNFAVRLLDVGPASSQPAHATAASSVDAPAAPHNSAT
jgi:hypothetical protein